MSMNARLDDINAQQINSVLTMKVHINASNAIDHVMDAMAMDQIYVINAPKDLNYVMGYAKVRRDSVDISSPSCLLCFRFHLHEFHSLFYLLFV